MPGEAHNLEPPLTLQRINFDISCQLFYLHRPSYDIQDRSKPRPNTLKLDKQSSVTFNPNAPGHVPGYTGYVRGKDYISGCSFGKQTRRACSNSVETLMCDTTVPPKVCQMPIQYEKPTDLVSAELENNPRRMPGYMGFVAGSRDKFGDTFGRTTAASLKNAYEYEGSREFADELEKRRQTAAGLGKDADGNFYSNNMTLVREK